MNPLIKKLHVALVLAVISSLSFLYVPSACSEEWSASDKVLSFLTDVVGLDVTQYNVTLVSNDVQYPSDLGGLPQENGKYSLISDESTLDVIYKFKNKTLYSCTLYVYNGSPLYVQSSVNVVNSAKSLLDKYQTYSDVSNLQPFLNLLDTVTEIEPLTKTVGDVKFTVSGREDSAKFEWVYTSNDLEFTRKRMTLTFEHGQLIGFTDGWSLYNVDCNSMIVSADDAISIARNATKDVPKLYTNVDNETIVLQPILAEEPTAAELMSGIKEPLTLCPLWHVQLYFDKFYGNYYGVAVDIWATTGEIIDTPYGTGIMGTIPNGENSEETQTKPFAESIDQTNIDLTLALMSFFMVLALILGVTFCKRKRNNSH